MALFRLCYNFFMQEKNENYKKAIELCEGNYTHNDLIDFLKNGNVIERQFAALNITTVNSKTEANILMSNLVGVDGKIREAAALKIAELTKIHPEKFSDKANYKILSQATIDIDGNVCRLAIISAVNLRENENFSKFYANEMIEIIQNSLDEMSKFTFRDKKYKINKQIFKIYWCIEALIYFNSYSNFEKLQHLIEKCSILPEYTIREKCAKLICTLPNNDILKTIKNTLKRDNNYYVRNIFE